LKISKLRPNISNGLEISLQHEKESQKKIHSAQIIISVNMIIYLIIAAFELVLGNLTRSAALVADGKNNVTGILSALILLVGLFYSSKPRDEFHMEGHWQYEVLAVFLSGLLMVLIGINCMWVATLKTIFIFNHGTEKLNIIACYAAGISGSVLLVEAWINYHKGVTLADSALLSSAKDYLSDAVTSFVTLIAIGIALITGWYLIDTFSAILLGAYISINGGQIISQSAAKLSNGFNPGLKNKYLLSLKRLPSIEKVIYMHARYSGDNIILELAVGVDANLTIRQVEAIRKDIVAILTADETFLYCCIEFRPFKN
jgi:cation diffusion facilitator family transporter